MQSEKSAKTTLKVARDPTWFRLYDIRGKLQKQFGHSLTFDQVIETLIDSYLASPDGSMVKA
jgi:hypothetical protein